MFSLTDKTLENPQDEDDTGDLPVDEVSLSIPEADIIDDQGRPPNPSSAADLMMNDEVLLPQGEEKRLAKVIKRSVDSDGKVIGNYNALKMLNTRLYDVKFPDGSIKPYSKNLIAMNILMQAYSDRLHQQLLEGILDHSKDNRAIEKKDKYFVTTRGS